MNKFVTLGMCVLLLGFTGCLKTELTDREAWLVHTLTQDNEDLIRRNAALVEQKYAKMASSAYAYFRATQAQFVRDHTEHTSLPYPTSFGSTASSRVIILGDPHLENIGTYFVGNPHAGDPLELTLEFNDFDGATLGPYYLDVRRMAVSFFVALQDLTAIADNAVIVDQATLQEVIQTFTEAYVSAIAGDAPENFRLGSATSVTPFFADLLDSAEGDGLDREELDDYTEINGAGERVIKYSACRTIEACEVPSTGFFDDTLVLPTRDEREMITSLLNSYPATPISPSVLSPSARVIKGVSRRLGGGISSYPLKRYYVLIEGATSSPSDDILLELKEAREPFEIDGLVSKPRLWMDSPAERIVRMTRILQSFHDADPLLGWGESKPMSFRVRDRIKFQKGFDIPDLRGPLRRETASIAELMTFAQEVGKLLAAAHSRATLRGISESPQASIKEALGTTESTIHPFTTEVVDFAMAYGERVLADYQSFLSLLDTEGPLLGVSSALWETP